MSAPRIDSEDIRVVDRGNGWAVVIERFGMSNPVGARLVRGAAEHPLVPRLLSVRPVEMTQEAAEALAADWRKFLRVQEAGERK